MSIVRAFNDHFETFITDVQRVFPEDINIATAKTGLKALRKHNPKIILTTFKEWVVTPYRTQIDAADLSFFISKDYGGDLEDFGYARGEYNDILSKIDTLRTPIGRMNTEERLKVVRYLQNLAKLCDLYV